MSCTCQVCEDTKRWEKALNPTTPEARAAFDEMLSRIEGAETDATVSSEIFKGRWPGSIEILERSLSIARESQERDSRVA